MNDMTSVIVPKSDQLNADDLIAGPRTITITAVTIRPGTEQPVSIHFEGDGGKPWKTCKSMNRVLVAAWGADANAYVGRSVTIYRDPNVKWAGMAVGGVRISHLSDIDREMVMALTETKGKRAPHVVKPLNAAPAQSDGRLTLKDAKAAIAGATTLEELGTAWKSRAMAPFREALQSELDARKAALTPGPDVSEHEQAGEPLSGRALADQLISEARLADDLPAWEREMEPRYLTLDDELRLEVDGEIAKVRAA